MVAGTFEYRARDRSGRVVRGVMEADSPDAVVRRLRQDGLFVASVTRADRRGPSSPGRSLWRRGPKPGEMALLCRQLAMMSRAGLTLVESLRLLAQQTPGGRLKAALEAVRRDIAAGISVGRAFGRHPDMFSSLMVQMIEVGEMTGSLDEVLEQLGTYFQREHELRSKIREALAYPTVVAVVALGVIAVLLFFVLPTFVAFFDRSGMPLPLPTRILLGFQRFVADWWYLLGAAALAGWLGMRAYLRTPKGRLARDRLLLHAPLIGPVVVRSVMARLTRTVSLGLRSGVAMVDALEAAERVVGNEAVRQALAAVRAGVEQGSSLARAMGRQKVFPELLVQMVTIGEMSGSLEDMLRHLAVRYEADVESAVKVLVGYVEPAIIVILAGVVLLIVSSVMLPLFQSAGMI